MKARQVFAVILASTLLMGALTGASLAAGVVTATSGNTYVRTGPGLGFKEMGILYKGESLEFLGDIAYDWRDVAWYCVIFKDMGDGWVSSKFTQLYDDGAYWGTCVEANAQVHVRSGPGIGYKSLGTLVRGERLEYLDQTKYDARGIAWYKAMFYSNGIVWVSSQYSELVYGTPGGGAGDLPATGTYVEATGDLNIRSGPGLEFADKGIMKKGDIALYLDVCDVDERGIVWYKVFFDGKTGWVSSRYGDLY